MAYVTLCTNLKTLPGVMVQLTALKRVRGGWIHFDWRKGFFDGEGTQLGSNYTTLVVVTKTLPMWAQQVLAILGAEIIQADVLPFNFHAKGGNRIKWAQAVVKLRIFAMSHYKRLVYFDADVLIQRNVDDLFDLPFSPNVQLYGMQDLHDCDLKFVSLNSGVLVLEPSEAAFKRLMENYKEVPSKWIVVVVVVILILKRSCAVHPRWGGDQDLIAHTYTGKTELLPESTATMMVQCACPIACKTCPKKKLSESRLVHGAGFLNIDVMSHFGAGKGADAKGGYMSCAEAQYDAWEQDYRAACAVIANLKRSGLQDKLERAEFCDLKPYPGKDAAWLKIKAMEPIHKSIEDEG